jgi:hypothetical protein
MASLSPLIDAGVLVEQRFGAGRRLVVQDPSALQQFIRNRFPDIPLDAAATARETALARFRDTKALPGDTPEIVSVRAWVEHAISGVQVHRATRDYGVFSFLLTGDCGLQLRGPWALVENPALFVHFERLWLSVPAVLYSRGKVSNRLLEWLATRSSPDFTLEHFPDYDPAGLLDYQRIRASLGTRAKLHMPEDLQLRFAMLSNPALLRKPRTRSMLASLRSSSCDEIQRVVAMIDQHNGGLEQEALLVNVALQGESP